MSIIDLFIEYLKSKKLNSERAFSFGNSKDDYIFTFDDLPPSIVLKVKDTGVLSVSNQWINNFHTLEINYKDPNVDINKEFRTLSDEIIKLIVERNR